MIRRVVGVLLCLLVSSAATFDVYADAAKADYSFKLQFETSYVSLDPVEDAGDTGYPDSIVNWSPREKIVSKLTLYSAVRPVRLTPPTAVLCGELAHSRMTIPEILRFQEVLRI